MVGTNLQSVKMKCLQSAIKASNSIILGIPVQGEKLEKSQIMRIFNTVLLEQPMNQ